MNNSTDANMTIEPIDAPFLKGFLLPITTWVLRFAEADAPHDVVTTPAMFHGQSGIRDNG